MTMNFTKIDPEGSLLNSVKKSIDGVSDNIEHHKGLAGQL